MSLPIATQKEVDFFKDPSHVLAPSTIARIQARNATLRATRENVQREIHHALPVLILQDHRVMIQWQSEKL